MEKLTRNDLLSLEQYAEQRRDFRRRVMAHKRDRKLAVGPNVTLLFEDRLTIQYQVQEMLRAERIFEPDAIQDELDAYNPLIPDGHNLKATMLVEFPDREERRRALARLIGLEDHVWVETPDHERAHAIANEDIDRANPEKTSAVHFLRIELDEASIGALKEGAAINVGIDHPQYRHAVEPVPDNVRKALLADLEEKNVHR
jgi:hypothetical protein